MDTATSKSTVNMVIAFLGVFALLALGAVYLLIDSGTTGDKVAIIVGPMGLALGAVAGILGKTESPVLAQPPVVMDPPVAPVADVAPHGPVQGA